MTMYARVQNGASAQSVHACAIQSWLLESGHVVHKSSKLLSNEFKHDSPSIVAAVVLPAVKHTSFCKLNPLRC